MSMKSHLARVRHLGSAKDGTHHWWMQRVTALALVPLTLWFVISVITGSAADYDAMRAWVSHPLTGSFLILMIAATFYHAALGVQVVIEDYVHGEGPKIALILLIKGACALLGLAGILSVLDIMLGG